MSFSVGPRDQTQAVRLGSKQLCMPSHLVLLTLLLLFNTTTGDGKMAQLLRTLAALPEAWFLKHLHGATQTSLTLVSGDLTLFWLVWAPGMHMTDRHM